MCGRFAINSTTNALLEQIVEAHGASAIFEWEKHWPENYNVAPTNDVPVAAELEGQRMIEAVRWGMVAPYAKEFGGKPVFNDIADADANHRTPIRHSGGDLKAWRAATPSRRRPLQTST